MPAKLADPHALLNYSDLIAWVDPAEEPEVSILVVGWRDAPHLTRCLASVEGADAETPFEVVVALNEPTAAIEAAVRSALPEDAVVAFRANLGFAGAVNQAAKLARGQYVLLLNDDTAVEPGWLDALIRTMRTQPKCGLVSSTFLDMDGAVEEAGWVVWSDGTTSSVPAELSASSMEFERMIDYGSGASLLVRREVWDELDGLDESYYPAYYEDLDLSVRARKAGWTTWYQPQSRLRHIRSASTGSLFKIFLSQRSMSTFVQRWPDLLHGCAAPGDLEEAVWLGMGSPLRVLAVSERPSQRFEEAVAMLTGSPNVHVAVACELPIAMSERFPGSVRVVHDLDRHLAHPAVRYDLVVSEDGQCVRSGQLSNIEQVSVEAVLGNDAHKWTDRLPPERR